MLPQVAMWLLISMGVGIVLVIAGLRGRRLNRHPVCRWCSFDLIGCPEGTVTCPECGAGLKRERAIRIGQRRRIYSAVAVGAAAIVVPLTTFSLVGYALATASDVNQFKPTGVLLWEARRADGTRLESIAKVLHDRAISRKLGDQYPRVVRAALEQQADRGLAWCETFGDIIDQAKLDGELTEEQEMTYRHQGAALQWEARPRVRSGDSLPVAIKLIESRVGASTMLLGEMIFLDATIGGKSATPVEASIPSMFGMQTRVLNVPMGWFYLMGGSQARWGGMGWQGGRLLLRLPAGIEPGQHEVNVRIGIKIAPYDYSGFQWGRVKKDDKDLRHVEWSTLIEVLPPDARVITMIDPTEELAEQIRSVFQPTDVQVHGSGRSAVATQQFGSGDSPVPVAFDVYWRYGEREAKIGSLTSGIDTSVEVGAWWGNQRWVSGNVPGFTGDTVAVILRPSPEVAARTIDLTSIYGGEVVLEDVPVEIDRGGRPSSILQWFLGR